MSATATSVAAVLPTSAVATDTPTPGITPTPTPRVVPTSRPRETPTSLPAGLVSASLVPHSVQPGGGLSASVVTTGSIDRVQLYIGSGLPTAPPPVAYDLSLNGGDSWSGNVTAPTVPGEYHYTVGLFVNGHRSVQDNDGWNLLVLGSDPTPTTVPGQGTGQAEPLPADIPLAPPFSYGNPVAVTFNGGGQSINGSEIISSQEPSTTASVVAQWFQVHLARAGWVVDSFGLPSGATTFSLSAMKGTGPGMRVCIVQYANSTVTIFYGTA